MAVVPEAPSSPVWLVDGFNVVSVALLRDQGRMHEREGFWRRENREALVARARAFDDPSAEVWIVFDGADADGNDEHATPKTVFAPSADEWLLERVRADATPERVTVVTADRRLENRVRSRGARVVSPGDFLNRCGAG